MNKFKIGDKVKIINSNDCYYNNKAIIKNIDKLDTKVPYYCTILDKNDHFINTWWYSEKSLVLLKNSEKYFTISIRKNKRIHLSFIT